MTAQEQYEQAECLAREASREGGPLPVELLQQAAAGGYAPALYALANWHLHGKGVRKNYRKAVALLKSAARQQVPAAEYDLAVAYEQGHGGLPKDLKAAFRWYRRAANDGDLDAAGEVARCYYHGLGIRRSVAKAVAWYRTAAERGDPEAQYALARAYELGEGIALDATAARHWYQRAAVQGNEQAQQVLGQLVVAGQAKPA